MSRFATLSDEFYVNMNLSTEMDLPHSRETVLHLFEQMKKRFPSMRNFYARERGEFVLEEGKDDGAYRWASIESKRISSGTVNPSSLESAMEQHGTLLELAPYALSLSPLDCESLSFMFGFDYAYRGNHNQLLIDALGISPSLEKLLEIDGAQVVASEPSIQIALDPECRLQCRVSFETRTSAYHVKTGEFPEDQISVYLTVRRYGSLESGETYPEVLGKMSELCESLVDEFLAENVLLPLQQAIITR